MVEEEPPPEPPSSLESPELPPSFELEDEVEELVELLGLEPEPEPELDEEPDPEPELVSVELLPVVTDAPTEEEEELPELAAHRLFLVLPLADLGIEDLEEDAFAWWRRAS